MKNYLFLLYIIFLSTFSFAQKDSAIIRKEYYTTFTEKSPKIDGDLSDEVWKAASILTGLKQNYPYFNNNSSQHTEVKIMYDNSAIYIYAKMYDTHPDSIAKQLGNRDDDLNSDNIRFVFDTYNTQQDAFDFSVYASGVQCDSRFSDWQYNAVWESATKINNDGWSCEIKIPYSALRFPNKDEQTWGLQVTRSIIRNGEFQQWGLTPRGTQNFYKYWGLLKGIKNIEAPLRLSLTPYITAYTSHYPANIDGESNYSSNITGGMDLKYGLNESFTLDMSLLPDFSQVQSDNVVKNLDAFEIRYDEQRSFFQENADLFQRGGLFYSRRIGRRPTQYYNVYSQVNEGEKIIKNPTQAKLLNLAKLSGRTINGTGIGILNAVLDNTYAIAKDTLGNERKILTEPFSNYNIVTVDQQLKNSSNIYIINTNVNRQKGYKNSNVTGIGGVLNNKKNTYGIFGDAALTQIFTPDSIKNTYSDLIGYNYNYGIQKTSGKIQFVIFRNGMNPTYQNNDMGYNQQVNYINNGGNISFNQFTPFGRFLNANITLNLNHQENFTTHRLNFFSINLNSNITARNFYNFYLGGNYVPTKEIDYYEPRTPGRVFIKPPYVNVWWGVNSDNRKKFNYSINMWAGSTYLITPTIGYNKFYGGSINPRLRATTKLSIELFTEMSRDNNDRGYVNTDESGNIIIGVRYIKNLTNSLNIKYLFKNNLSLSVNSRHYWTNAHYPKFCTLSEDGLLYDNLSYNQNHDFNFNAFNVDMVLQWQFAPGSFATLVWKNQIYAEESYVIKNYMNDLNQTFNSNQLNTVSLRVLYYFDYLYLRKLKKK